MEPYMPYVWLAVIVIATIIEAATSQMVSIWFVAGGIGALIANLMGTQMWTQFLVFILITSITLIATRPIVNKMMNFKKTVTNADRYIGKYGTVITEINNTLGKGQVNVSGSIWTARSADNKIIEVNQKVIIKSIEGVKLIVKTAD